MAELVVLVWTITLLKSLRPAELQTIWRQGPWDAIANERASFDGSHLLRGVLPAGAAWAAATKVIFNRSKMALR